ncbi:MAG: ferrochelatase [Acidobacteria bacterium]|nr:ferrochelatase [Acidobacteriota bacterium]
MGFSFDSVLLIAFGGPEGPDDVRPFLENVVRGRRVPASRLDEVAHHYQLFGGVSPLASLTRRQATGLAERLQAAGHPLSVHVGMRNWHPFLADTLAEMSRAGARHAIGFIAAAHHSYSSCEQYRRNVADARADLRRRGEADVGVTYVDSWYAHDGFITANAAHVAEALARLPDETRASARLVFTAHSIPVSMAERSRYREQLRESARLVAQRLGRPDWALVYQSRSGRPDDPWLGPDVVDYLRAERGRGLTSVVLCPIGFVCDHIEVLYDLDHEAATISRELGIRMERASAVNLHPAFLDLMADLVLRTVKRYERARPLPLVSPSGL